MVRIISFLKTLYNIYILFQQKQEIDINAIWQTPQSDKFFKKYYKIHFKLKILYRTVISWVIVGNNISVNKD